LSSADKWFEEVRGSEALKLARTHSTRHIQPKIRTLIDLATHVFKGKVFMNETDDKELKEMAGATIDQDFSRVFKVLITLPDLAPLLLQCKFMSLYTMFAQALASGWLSLSQIPRKDRKLSDSLTKEFTTLRMHTKEFRTFVMANEIPEFRKTANVKDHMVLSRMNMKFECSKSQIEAVLQSADHYIAKVWGFLGSLMSLCLGSLLYEPITILEDSNRMIRLCSNIF